MESSGALGKFVNLNKDCKLFESAIGQPYKMSIDSCLNILNDEDKPISLKY